MISTRRRRITWLVMAVGSLVAALGVFALKDKALEQWYLRKLDAAEGEEQRTVIRRLGELRSASAVPRLVELFRAHNTRRSFDRSDLHLREALVSIGEPAIPHLVELTRNRLPSVRSAAWTVLGRSPAVAIPYLLDDFDTASDEDRAQRLENLARMGSHGSDVPVELARAYADTSPRVRQAAITALVTIGPESNLTIETLETALDDEDGDVRFAAAVHLAQVSDPRAKAALPELVSVVMNEISQGYTQWRATSHAPGRKQGSAVRALSQVLARLNLPVPPELLGASRDARPRVRAAALDALATIVPTSRSTVETLAGALEDKNKLVRFAAATCLMERTDPRAKDAPQVLIATVSDASLGRSMRDAAARLLASKRCVEAVPALIERLNDEHPHAAIRALASIGPPAKAAIPLLTKLAEDPGSRSADPRRASLRRLALMALAAIRKEDVFPGDT